MKTTTKAPTATPAPPAEATTAPSAPPAKATTIPGALTRAVRCRPDGPLATGLRQVVGKSIPADAAVELPADEAAALVAEYPGLELVES